MRRLFDEITFSREHKALVKKAMNYISNRTSCVTFELGSPSSLNFVTIAPGQASKMLHIFVMSKVTICKLSQTFLSYDSG